MHIHYKYIYTIYIYIARLWNERGNFLFQQTCVSSRGKKSSPKSPALYYTTERVIYQTNKWVRLFFFILSLACSCAMQPRRELVERKICFLLAWPEEENVELGQRIWPRRPLLYITCKYNTHRSDANGNQFQSLWAQTRVGHWCCLPPSQCGPSVWMMLFYRIGRSQISRQGPPRRVLCFFLQSFHSCCAYILTTFELNHCLLTGQTQPRHRETSQIWQLRANTPRWYVV